MLLCCGGAIHPGDGIKYRQAREFPPITEARSTASNSSEVKTNMAQGDSKAEKKTPPSMSMIEPRLRNIYLQFYKESYFTPSALDLKTKELIAIGCSVIAKCEGCLEGHLKKASQMGITKEEISDALAIAIGIAAAAVLDQDFWRLPDSQPLASDSRLTPAFDVFLRLANPSGFQT